ncbi:hypothetical protein RMATCC62417_12648 [Rhizopus microsporus]|nr:hypothetical protein RMATCC62417_12648 [Rhizopus microsporus]
MFPLLAIDSSLFYNYINTNITAILKKLSTATLLLTFVEELALNGIMWMNERIRRNYYINEETWKAVIKEPNIEFKEDDGYKDYGDVDKISEAMHNA